MILVHQHSWTLAFLCLASIFPYIKAVSHSLATNSEHGLCGQNANNKYTVQEFTDEELFARGHMKPFGSHRPPDEIVEELPFMISPQDFYMKYVLKHKPVVIKGKLTILTLIKFSLDSSTLQSSVLRLVE